MIPIVIIGAGPAGIFAAIQAASHPSRPSVVVLEKTKRPLAKVKISGGGRCNVTHACFDPKLLIQNYPRGSKELLGPFNRFGPQDTMNWFEARGVKLKTEADGRIFPTTNSSQTIIDCLLDEAKSLGISLQTEMAVQHVEVLPEGHFCLHFENRPKIYAQMLLLATGSAKGAYSWLSMLGHTIQATIPSLFTLNIKEFPLTELAGVSVSHASICICNTNFSQSGPLLITHWGFSGPCALKLSSFAARYLHDVQYKAPIVICWVPESDKNRVIQVLKETKALHPKQNVISICPFNVPKSLWKMHATRCGANIRWADMSREKMQHIAELLTQDRFEICGQSANKEEFVTCGGISLQEVDFKTMASKIITNCFFAGEVLDVDAITGGFNFQNAWTTGYIAGTSMACIRKGP